jgi:Uncharacterized conserved protein
MPKGYWIGRVNVHDPEGYKAYFGAAGPVFAEYGGHFIIRGGEYVAAEGGARDRKRRDPVPELPGGAGLLPLDGYQRAKAVRDAISDADVLIIEGYEGPQPGDAG